MGNLLHLVVVVGLVCASAGLAGETSVFAPAEADVSELPANPLQSATHVPGTPTALLIAQSTYALPAADYAPPAGSGFAPHVMGAYRVPDRERETFSLRTTPTAAVLTPEALALNAELGHMILSAPADMGRSTRGTPDMPLGFLHFDTMPVTDFNLRDYRDGIREVLGHLR